MSLKIVKAIDQSLNYRKFESKYNITRIDHVSPASPGTQCGMRYIHDLTPSCNTRLCCPCLPFCAASINVESKHVVLKRALDSVHVCRSSLKICCPGQHLYVCVSMLKHSLSGVNHWPGVGRGAGRRRVGEQGTGGGVGCNRGERTG